jgi:CDP-diacylglycerol--serine O-phosphatidyltransferase
MTLPAFPRPRRRGIYILPNLFTTAALFCGFFAIVQAMNEHFEIAAIAIFVAMVFDGLDGRIARLTQTQSEFGAEYDSLSDMVCFGAAPALVVYEWALMGLGKLGWIVAFIYCAGAALRLARFNTNIDIVDKRFFQGLPSPAAAALIAGLVWVSIDNGTNGADARWLACLLTLFAGISMVSNVPFWSGKSINLRKSVPFIAVIAVVLAFALGASYPPGIFFALFVGYALSGYALYAWRWQRQRAQSAAPSTRPPQDDESDARHASATETAQSIHSADTILAEPPAAETPPAQRAQDASSPDSGQSEQA